MAIRSYCTRLSPKQPFFAFFSSETARDLGISSPGGEFDRSNDPYGQAQRATMEPAEALSPARFAMPSGHSRAAAAQTASGTGPQAEQASTTQSTPVSV